MFIPYSVDVPYDRTPFANWLIVAGIVAVFGLQLSEALNFIGDALEQQTVSNEPQNQPYNTAPPQTQAFDPESSEFDDEEFVEEHSGLAPNSILGKWALKGWGIRGLFGHMWLHGGFLHIIGNLIFLWVFGNAVCAKISNKIYLPMYIVFGLIAGLSHLIFSGGAMIGASGAINGVVGMFLVFFPENEVNCLWVLFLPYVRRISVSSYWIILMWFVFDVLGAIFSSRVMGGVAYFAHVGGFVAGFGFGILMLKMKWIGVERYEKSILQLVGLEKKEGEGEFKHMYAGWQRQYVESQTQKPAAAPPPAQTATVAAEPARATGPPAKPAGQFIRVACKCGKGFTVPLKFAGKAGKCPKCGGRVEIPAAGSAQKRPVPTRQGPKAQDVIRFGCPCGKRFKVPRSLAGKSARCPQCGRTIKIPDNSTA